MKLEDQSRGKTINELQSYLSGIKEKIEPHNPSCFYKLWSRCKLESNLLDENQTLYSFRYTGAIEIFNRTGSITKLQEALEHYSVNVSLT